MLHRNSAYLCRRAALASSHDTSGRTDKTPVLIQSCRASSVLLILPCVKLYWLTKFKAARYASCVCRNAWNWAESGCNFSLAVRSVFMRGVYRMFTPMSNKKWCEGSTNSSPRLEAGDSLPRTVDARLRNLKFKNILPTHMEVF